MTKKLDWSSVASVNFDDNRRKNTKMMTGKELFAKALEKEEKIRKAFEMRKEVEPLLRDALLKAMTSRTPIKVLSAISNPTEALGGLVKSEDDDDGFYNSNPAQKVESQANARFEEVMETIPSGTELIYKSWDKQLGQWIFKSVNGREYAIYDKSVILYKGNPIENPGLYGLLFNTDLIDTLGE
jgi:hypothetical protein